MIAACRASAASPIADSDTAACTGFIDDRANTGREGSPAEATSLPSASQTATWTRCSDSTSPERTTRTSAGPFVVHLG
jgi:hypothetical protein